MGNNIFMGNNIGYSHAIFGGDENLSLKRIALNVDKNNNGLIDVYKDEHGNTIDEIQLFKAAVKKEYNYRFSFDGITQCQEKNINIFDGDQRKYKYYSEINRDYKSSLSQTMATLNPYDDFTTEAAKKYYKENGVRIAYMSENNYNRSVKNVSRQNSEIDNIENVIKEKIENKYSGEFNISLDPNSEYHSPKVLLVTINKDMTLTEIKQKFGMQPGELIAQNPNLKDLADNPGWWDKTFHGAKRDFDNITLKAGMQIRISVMSIDVGQ